MRKFVCGLSVLGAMLLAGLPAEAADKGDKGGKGGKGGKGPMGDSAAMFKRLDANSDGKVTLDEFTKMGGRGKGPGKADGAPFAQKMFQRLDANNDGGVTVEEFKKSGPQRGPKKNK